MLVEIHTAILQRLAPLVQSAPGLQLRLMPNSPNAYIRDIPTSGGVLFLSDSRFDKPERKGIQKWMLEFALELRLPTNWPEDGMIHCLEAACRLLIGYQPPHCDRVVLDRTPLDGEFGDYWVRRIVFFVPTRLMSGDEAQDLETDALLRRIEGLAPETDRTLFDASIPGPDVTAPAMISASVNGDGDLVVNWGAPDPVEGQDLIGYILQLNVDGEWTRSQVLPVTETNTFTYAAAMLDPMPTQARIAAMWTNENSEFDAIDIS
jgi:hypothetical protein